MKLFLKLSLLLTLLITSTAFAGWTIPGTGCVSQNFLDGGYATNSIYNPLPREPNKNKYIYVFCSSAILSGYGKVLDIDFYVENASLEGDLTCEGFSLNLEGNIVQQTERVTAKKGTKGYVTLTAKKKTTYDNENPVYIGTKCSLPDRGLNYKFLPSQLISVRIY